MEGMEWQIPAEKIPEGSLPPGSSIIRVLKTPPRRNG